VTDIETPAQEITAKRAYAETLLVFLAFFGGGVISAVYYLADPNQPVSSDGWAAYLPGSFDILAQAGLAVALVLLLLHRRGLGRRDVGLAITRPDGTRLAWGPSLRVLALAEIGQFVGSLVNSALGGKYPGQTTSGSYLFYMGAASINAGVVEELVVLAFVVTTLRQARRPWWEVALVAIGLRVSYHLYYGAGAIGVLIWAAVFFWLYARTKNLPMLMLVHVSWDLCVFLSLKWPWVVGAEFVCAALLVVWAAATWLIDRSGPPKHLPAGAHWPATATWDQRATGGAAPGWLPGGVVMPEGGVARGASPAEPPAMPWPADTPMVPISMPHTPPPPLVQVPLPPANWYPDPSGRYRWRRWNGSEWTGDVSNWAVPPAV
jgi:membrane protease YdiL (CAAX protease family)